MKYKIRIQIGSLKSLVAFFYFTIAILHNVNSNVICGYLWDAVIFTSFLFGIVHYRNILRDRSIVLFLILYVLTSFFNLIFIGNHSWKEIAYTFLYMGIFLFLSDEEISIQSIKAAIIASNGIIIATFLRKGIGTAILKDVSNNYVSVLLFMPMIIYYIRLEREKKPISLFPAGMVLLSCLLAVGRGGILSAAVFLAGLIGDLFFNSRAWKSVKKRNNFRILVLMAILLLLLISFELIPRIWNSSVLQRFTKHGFYGTGRGGIWAEYISNMVNRVDYFFFGVDFDVLFQMIRYKNNLHNSFLNIHVYNGIFMLGYIALLSIGNIYRSLQKKEWIFLFCTLMFFLRAFTDKIFWGGVVGTPILFYLLWYGRRRNLQKQAVVL